MIRISLSVLIAAIGVGAVPRLAYGQTLEELAERATGSVIPGMQEFLAIRGRTDDGPRLEGIVLEAKKDFAPGMLDAIARVRAYQLALSGHSADYVLGLREKGLDLPRIVLKSPMELSLEEKAALSEATVIGTVVDIQDTLEPGDGFRSSVIFRVEEVLSGRFTSDELILRRLTGPDSLGGMIRHHEFDGRVGETFILYVSHEIYKYHILHPEPAAADVRDGLFAQDLVQYVLFEYTAVPVPDAFLNERVADEDPHSPLNKMRQVGVLKASLTE